MMTFYFYFSTWLNKIEKQQQQQGVFIRHQQQQLQNIERVKGFSKANDVMARLVVVIVVVVVCPRN